MTLGIRKLIVLILVAAVFLLANVWLVVNWLDNMGVVDGARYVKNEFLTGTALTIIVVLLILLVKPGRATTGRFGLIHHCPVCDHRLLGSSKYCSDCGSKAN